jgi:hypothetical protein
VSRPAGAQFAIVPDRRKLRLLIAGKAAPAGGGILRNDDLQICECEENFGKWINLVKNLARDSTCRWSRAGVIGKKLHLQEDSGGPNFGETVEVRPHLRGVAMIPYYGANREDADEQT